MHLLKALRNWVALYKALIGDRTPKNLIAAQNNVISSIEERNSAAVRDARHAFNAIMSYLDDKGILENRDKRMAFWAFWSTEMTLAFWTEAREAAVKNEKG